MNTTGKDIGKHSLKYFFTIIRNKICQRFFINMIWIRCILMGITVTFVESFFEFCIGKYSKNTIIFAKLDLHDFKF